MRKISGRLRKRSIHAPAAMLSGRIVEIRPSASPSPTIKLKTIAISAISRLTRKPSRMNRTLLPVVSHSQLSGSKR